MVWTFCSGIALLLTGFFSPFSAGLRQVLIRAGWLCLAAVAVLADFNATAVAALFVLIVTFTACIAFLYWLDDGRFDQNRIRASVGWFFATSGPGAPPIRNGFIGLAVLTLVVLTALLVVRPVARTAMGLDAGPDMVMTERAVV